MRDARFERLNEEIGADSRVRFEAAMQVRAWTLRAIHERKAAKSKAEAAISNNLDNSEDATELDSDEE